MQVHTPQSIANVVPDVYHNVAGTNTKVLVNTGIGNLYGVQLENNHATDMAYIQIFNKAATADVTLGTTVPDYSVLCPPSSVVALGWPVGEGPLLHCHLGIVIAITLTRTGSSAPTNTCGVTVWSSLR